MIPVRTCLAVVLAGAAIAPPASANTLELLGFGARSAAMGNTGEAAADDYFATFSNPANLALAKQVHGGLGFDFLRHTFAIDQAGGSDRYPARLPQDNELIHVGMSTPLGGWLQDRAALGIAFHLPLTGPTRLDALDYRTPQLVLWDTLPDRLQLVLGAGVRPLDWLAFGASVQVLTALTGVADIDVSVLDHRITKKSLDVALATEAFPIAGATVTPNADWRIALVWRAASHVRYDLPLDVHLDDIGNLRFAIQGVGLWVPESWTLGAAWNRDPWSATAALAWQRWGVLPQLAPNMTLDADDADLLPPGTPPDAILHVRNRPAAMGARDIVVPRAGGEFRFGRWALRAGVQHRPTFLPRADGIANYLDAPATTVSFGGRARFADPLAVQSKPLDLDLTVSWTQLNRRTVWKLDPDDPVRGTSVAGGSLHVAVGVHHDF
jgi:long-chain fatty acid transport protein